MRYIPALVVGAFTVVYTGALSAQTPNFSGTWVRDATKTAPDVTALGPGHGQAGDGGNRELTITMDSKVMKVSGVSFAGVPRAGTESYRLDGSETRSTLHPIQGRGSRGNSESGAGDAGEEIEITSAAKWQGATLTLVIKVEADSAQISGRISTMHLSMDGGDLRIEQESSTGGAPLVAEYRRKGTLARQP